MAVSSRVWPGLRIALIEQRLIDVHPLRRKDLRQIAAIIVRTIFESLHGHLCREWAKQVEEGSTGHLAFRRAQFRRIDMCETQTHVMPPEGEAEVERGHNRIRIDYTGNHGGILIAHQPILPVPFVGDVLYNVCSIWIFSASSSCVGCGGGAGAASCSVR